MKKKKKLSVAEIKRYKEWQRDGMGEYLLTQGGKTGIIFAFFMFLLDYSGFLSDGVEGAGVYIFYAIFFGLFMGLWGWRNINKAIKEQGKKK